MEQSSAPLNFRPQSPLGLARQSRMFEKAELQNHNDRLACYIDRVRVLEVENARLSHEVQTIVESHSREKTNIKRIFECEFVNIRKALDESVKEKTRLEIEMNRLHEENANLKNHLARKTKELSVAQAFEAKNNDLLAKYNKIEADRKKALDNNSDLEKEIANLNSALNDLHKHLEEETLGRVEAENIAQSLREELALNSQMDRTQEMDVEKHTILTNFANASDDGTRLEKSLQQLRDQYEAIVASNRQEIDSLYKTKLEHLQVEATRANASAASAIKEIRTAGKQISSLNAKISEFEGQASSHLSRIRDLESMLDKTIGQRGEDQAEIIRLSEQMAQQVQEYQELMDVKISLDLEIAAYGELLTGEEERFKNSIRANGDECMQNVSRKRKRISTDIETDDIEMPSYSIVSLSKGDLEIQESCPEGKYVRIYNNTDNEIDIGGWHLKRSVGGDETIFKFRRSFIIGPKATAAVWSANAEAQHEPPENTVMKRNWIPSETSKTQLFNADHEEMANIERKANEMDSNVTQF